MVGASRALGVWVGKAGRQRSLEDAARMGGIHGHPVQEIMVRGAFCKGDGSVLPGMGLQGSVPYAGAMPVAS